MLYLRTFGGLSLERDGAEDRRATEQRKRLAFLAVLAASGESGLARDKLLALLWPESSTTRARASLKQTVFALRHDLHNSDLITGTVELRLNPDHIRSDIGEFRTAVSAGDSERTFLLYRGAFLDGVTVPDAPELDEWIEGVRASVLTEVRRAGVALGRGYESAGEWAAAAAVWERMTREDPLDAEIARCYITTLARSGDSARALRHARTHEMTVQRELGANIDPSLATLIADIRANRLQSSPKAYARVDHRGEPTTRAIPKPTGSFVGRAAEVSDACAMLHEVNVLTISGPGGTGKTRLAIEVAAAVEGEFRDGACYVPLAGVPDATLVPQCLAEALGYSFAHGRDQKMQILDYLRHRRMLILFDNFEQLLDAAPFVSAIGDHCSDLRLLVTSQEPLGIAAEAVVVLGGLSWRPTADGLGPAVELFVRRSRRANQRFAPDAAEINAIVSICEAIGGLPFAIEIAAAFARSMSCRQMAAELERSPDILASMRRDVPERQRSLRRMFEYSMARLSDDDRLSLARMSVLRDPVPVAVAIEVGGTSASALAQLVDRSLIRWDPVAGYDLHPVFRPFLREWLDAHVAALEEAEAARLVFVTGVVQTVAATIRRSGPRGASEASAQMNNLRSALDWAIQKRDTESLLAIVPGLLGFMEMAGWYDEAVATARRARAVIQSPSPATARLMIYEARSFGRSVPMEGRLLAAQAAALARETEDRALLVEALTASALISIRIGEYRSGLADIDAALAEAGDNAIEPRLVADAYGIKGTVLTALGDGPGAEQCFEQALAMGGRAHDIYGRIAVLNGLAAARDITRPDESTTQILATRELLAEALQLARRIGYARGIMASLSNLAVFELRRGDDPHVARSYAGEGLITALQHGTPEDVVAARSSLGEALLRIGDHDDAKREFAQAIRLAWESGLTPKVLSIFVTVGRLFQSRVGDLGHRLLSLASRHAASMDDDKRHAQVALSERGLVIHDAPGDIVTLVTALLHDVFVDADQPRFQPDAAVERGSAHRI